MGFLWLESPITARMQNICLIFVAQVKEPSRIQGGTHANQHNHIKRHEEICVPMNFSKTLTTCSKPKYPTESAFSNLCAGLQGVKHCLNMFKQTLVLLFTSKQSNLIMWKECAWTHFVPCWFFMIFCHVSHWKSGTPFIRFKLISGKNRFSQSAT